MKTDMQTEEAPDARVRAALQVKKLKVPYTSLPAHSPEEGGEGHERHAACRELTSPGDPLTDLIFF